MTEKRSCVEIKYSFGENVIAIVERLDLDLNREGISADDICRRILTEELSAKEIDHIKKFYHRTTKIFNEVRRLPHPLLTESNFQNMMRRYYLADDLRSFDETLEEWSQVVENAYETRNIDEVLKESSLKSIEVVRKVARLYSHHWETRKSELATIADDLQRAINYLKNPLEKVESTLRGRIGYKWIDYYIVDNKYPSCSARQWGGERWIVGWSDPLDMAKPEVVIQVISDEASHWILEHPFTDAQRRELAIRLGEYIDEQECKHVAEPLGQQVLLEGVDGACMVLSEGYGHTFMGFPWAQDMIPEDLPQPRRMGRRGTLYAESYHFTRWFHDNWKKFLKSPRTSAEDWAWQCVNENVSKFMEVAVKFMERGTIYEHYVN